MNKTKIITKCDECPYLKADYGMLFKCKYVIGEILGIDKIDPRCPFLGESITLIWGNKKTETGKKYFKPDNRHY
jgi:hypothetical protein